MTPLEKLAAITAMEKAVKAAKEDIRADAEAYALGMSEEAGVDRFKLRFGTSEVGTVTVTERGDGYEVTDKEALDDFLLSYGLARIEKSIYPDWMHQAISWMEENHPEGVRSEVVPIKGWDSQLEDLGGIFSFHGEPVLGVSPAPKSKGIVVRGCDPAKTMQAMLSANVTMEQLLLGGGE